MFFLPPRGFTPNSVNRGSNNAGATQKGSKWERNTQPFRFKATLLTAK